MHASEEEDPEESWREDTTLFDPAADVEGLRGAAIELYGPLYVAVEGLNQALQLGWAANLGQDSEEALYADKVERLREIDESDVQGHLLSLQFSWSWRREKTMSTVDLAARKPHCDSG